MTTFTKGQKVLKARGTSRYIRIGEEVTVASVDLPALGEHWITLEGHGDKEFLADDFDPVEAAPAPLDPSQKARVEIADWDDFQEFDVVVQMPSLEGGPFVVERHQPAPEPEPEWKPGTVYGADGQSERYWFSDDGSSDGAVFLNDVGDEYAPSELAHLDLKSLVLIDPAKVGVHALADLYEDKQSASNSRTVAMRAVLAALGLEQA